jgi:hypothetical protein
MIFIGDYKPILKIQNTILYKEEGEVQCNSQCHYDSTKNISTHLATWSSVCVLYSFTKLMAEYCSR